MVMIDGDKMLPNETIWLGTLSGWWVSAEGNPVLIHRCGYDVALTGADVYLGNMIENYIMPHRETGCLP